MGKLISASVMHVEILHVVGLTERLFLSFPLSGQALGIPTVLVPPSPGIASAIGMLVADIRHELVATRRLRLTSVTPATLDGLFTAFLAEAEA
jgi:N-methylhydantoinase A/oxoprolinase/acetone carboxylase beta subunit